MGRDDSSIPDAQETEIDGEPYATCHGAASTALTAAAAAVQSCHSCGSTSFTRCCTRLTVRVTPLCVCVYRQTAMAEIEAMKAEIDKLHRVLEKKGINSKGTTDAYGREFSVPVDAEHKATALVLCNFDNPHNRAFHTSWFGFFSSFFSMFAAAPLIPFMRKPTSLNLAKWEIGTGNILALSSNIVMRVVVGCAPLRLTRT